MPKLIFCVIFQCWFIGLFAQNNPCTNPKVVNSLPYSSQGSTCNNIKISNTCGYPNKNGKGEVYQINVPTGVTCLKVNLRNIKGNLADRHFLYLMDDCPLSNPNANCLYTNSFLGLTPSGNFPTQNMDLPAGGTYYFVITSYIITENGGEGQPDIELDCGTFDITIEEDLDCPVYQDNCAMEEVISLPFVSNQNACNGKSMVGIVQDKLCTSSGAFKIQGHEFVYHYRNDLEDVCADLKLTSTSNKGQVIISEYCKYKSGTQGSSCLIAFDNEVTYILDKGKDYYFHVTHSTDASDCYAFTFEVTGNPILNVSCPTAINIPNPSNYTDENDFSCQKYPNSILPTCKIEDYRNYYRFTIDKEVCYQVAYKRLFGNPFDDVEVKVYDGCPEDAGTNCIPRTKFTHSDNQQIADHISKFQLSPGTYYMVVSEENQANKYRIKTYTSDHDPELEKGTCTNPYNNTSKNLVDTLLFDPCSPMGTAKQHREQCDIPVEYGQQNFVEGSTKIVRFTAQTSSCYLFQVSDTAHLQTMTLFDLCPSDPNATCLASAIAFNNYRNKDRVDLSDSLAFTINLTAGQTVYWTIIGQSFAYNTYAMPIKVTAVGEDGCFDCEEDICKACAGVATETSEISGWKMYVGDFNDPDATEVFPGTKGPRINLEGRHVVTSAGTYDQNAPVSVSNPFTGRYSIRLGNANANAEAEQMSFTYTVDANSTFFTYYYAVVFEDPGHAPEDQPYFRVRVLTENGEEIGCGVYEVSAGAGIAGFKQSKRSEYNPLEEPLYKDWEAVSIPVSAFVGQDLTVEFITRDCAIGDHYGYAYFDATCESLGNLDDDIILCQGDSVALVAPPGFDTYTWDNGKTGQIIYTSNPGDFHVDMLTRTGCQYAEDAKVVQEDNPLAYGLDHEQDCNGNTVNVSLTDKTANALNGIDHYWVINSKDTIFDVDSINFTNVPGKYLMAFHYIIPNKCSFLIEDSIPIYPTINDNTQLPDTTFCAGDSIRFEVEYDPLVTYEWDNGDTLAYTYFKTEGDHWLRRFAGTCKDSISLNIQEIPNHKFQLGADTVICWNDSIQIGTSPTANTTYLWNTGETVPQIYARDSAVYILENNTSGCINRDTLVLGFHRQAFVKLPADTQLCNGDSLTIGFADTKSHLWSTGATTDSIIVKEEGWYKLELYDAFCSEVDSIYIDTLTPPKFNMGPDTGFCEQTPVMLAINNSFNNSPYSILWSTGETNNQISVNAPGFYSVSVSDGSCSSIDSIFVTQFSMPNADFPVDTFFCHQSSLDLGFNVPGDYEWSTGETSNSINIASPGLYKLVIQNGTCVWEDSTVVDEHFFSFDLGQDQSICDGLFIEIGVDIPSAQNYLWSTMEISDSIVVSKEGTYFLDVFDGYCYASDTLDLTVFEAPKITKHSYAELACYDEQIKISLSCENCLFQGSGQNVFVDYKEIGDSLSYKVSTANSCSDSLAILIRRNPACPYDLFVPNAFSPSGDGINEVFIPVISTTELGVYEFQIFDRWGTELFYTEDILEGWDGLYKGAKVFPGVYVWKLKLRVYDQVIVRNLKGTVTVLR